MVLIKIMIAIILSVISCVKANNLDESPIRYIGGCELDLNGDSLLDKAILMESRNGMELIAMLAEKENYKTYLMYKGPAKNLFISCEYLSVITETVAGAGHSKKGKKYIINSFVIRLTQPEASSSIFYWKNGKFEQVWTAD